MAQCTGKYEFVTIYSGADIPEGRSAIMVMVVFLLNGGKRYILNIVDVVTGFSVQQTWRGGLNNRQTSRIVKELIDTIRKWRGAWPRQTELRTDKALKADAASSAL